MKKWIAFSVLLIATMASAQNYPPYLLYDSSGNPYPNGSGTPLGYNPPPFTCYTNATGQTLPCNFSGGSTTLNPLTMNNSGTGAASGATFNGSAAVILSTNTIGALNLAGGTMTGPLTVSLASQNALYTPTPLATPSAPTVVSTGGASTTWNYLVAARNASGSTVTSAAGVTTTGAAALDGTHYNTITWAAVPGATGYDVYHGDAVGAGVYPGGRIAVNASGTSVVDNTAASGNLDCCILPAVNSTGNIYSDFGITAQGTTWFGPTDTSALWYGFGENARHASNVVVSNATIPLYAFYAYKENNTPESGAEAIYGQANALGSGEEVIGVEGDAYYTGSDLTNGVSYLQGVLGSTAYEGTGPVTQYMAAFDALTGYSTDPTQIPANYGVYVEDQSGVSSTANVGLGIADQNGTAGPNWAIKTGIGLNSFGDNIQQTRIVATSALPACASGTLLMRAAVNDATSATPGTALVGSGTYTIAVQCIYHSVGTVYSWIID